MKTRFLALSACALVLNATACGSDDDDTTAPTELQRFSVLIDGTQFDAVNGGAARAGNTVTLTGIATTGSTVKTITIAIQASASGTLTVGGAGGPSITYSEQPSGGTLRQWAAGEGAGSGTIVLTELSATKAIGTFLANLPPVTATGATTVKALTLGSFNLLF